MRAVETPGAAATWRRRAAARSRSCLKPRPLRASSAGDTTSRQAREIESADCVHGSRERDRGQGVAAVTESGASPRDMFSVRARRGPGDRICAGGDFAKPRVLCINAKLGGRFAKFAQMQNSFAKPLEPSFCGFLHIIKCKTDLERPLEMLLQTASMQHGASRQPPAGDIGKGTPVACDN